MFCSKCGKENSDSSKFCSGCGSILQQQANVIETTRKTPSMEAISFTEHPTREQTTIDMHQKFGWSLKSNQEINTSTTHVYGQSYRGTGTVNSYIIKEHYVKLTFERDKNMPNYSILKEKYDKFTALANRITDLEASVHKRKKKFYFLCCIPSIIMILLIIIQCVGSPFGFIMFPAIIPAIGSAPIIMLIANAIAEMLMKKKIAPTVADLYRQMGMIADEAEQYLY